MSLAQPEIGLPPEPRARALVAARAGGYALPDYPGMMPETLAEAYRIQDAAIAAWPDRVAGWKVGRILPPWEARLGTDRLAGPIFAGDVREAFGPAETAMAVFAGGFAAVEGEIVAILRADAPPDKTDWTLAEAAAMVASMRLGVEIASSPFPGINDHGPLVTISDFGNNKGLIIGPEIADWRAMRLADWSLETWIDGVLVGAGDASLIPGGPLESLRAALEICARRGHPLKAGMAVSTGAVTGVHAARPGQSAVVRLGEASALACRLVPVSRV